MTLKSAFVTGTLIFSAFASAGAKSYSILLSEPVVAGEVQLTPGEYKMKIEGSSAIINAIQTGRSYTVPVKVENTDKKYNSTALDTTRQGASERLTSIELGGSTMKIEFGE